VDKWWDGGADALFDALPDYAAALTEAQLHDEGVATGEDVSANLGKNWALVRV
jgi:hypothetical protein